jgi:hypothetical protein
MALKERSAMLAADAPPSKKQRDDGAQKRAAIQEQAHRDRALRFQVLRKKALGKRSVDEM